MSAQSKSPATMTPPIQSTATLERAADQHAARPIGAGRPPLRRLGPMPVDFDVVTDPVSA